MKNIEYFKKIRDFYRAQKRMPTYSEIMTLTGYKSKNAVYKLIDKLIDFGLMGKDKSGHLLPGATFNHIPLLGVIEAGFPSPAEEELTDTMSMDEYLIKNKEATFMLKVQGDSMTGAGIMPGDMVLVERGVTPKNDDIVVAEVDGEWTLKTLCKTGNKVVLMPANPKYKPIVPKNSLDIAAVVKAVIRKY